MDKLKQLALNIRNNPGDSFSKFALALEFLKLDEKERARQLFESIEQNDSGYVGVYYHLGKLYISVDENKKALSTYKKGIEIAVQQKDDHAKSELESALLELELEMEDI